MATIRLGWIVPSINVTAEDELISMAPTDVGVHIARAIVDLDLPLDEQFAGMVDQLPELAVGLSHADVAVVAFACTSAGFYRGRGPDRELTRAMSDAAGVPAVTTASAVVEALRALGAGTVAVATPYVEWVREAERTFLESTGFEVDGIVGLDRRGGADISSIGGNEIRALVDEVDSSRADTVFVSCTDLPSAHLIEELETHHGKPVITSNQATLWACARRAGMGPIPGFGRLLQLL